MDRHQRELRRSGSVVGLQREHRHDELAQVLAVERPGRVVRIKRRARLVEAPGESERREQPDGVSEEQLRVEGGGVPAVHVPHEARRVGGGGRQAVPAHGSREVRNPELLARIRNDGLLGDDAREEQEPVELRHVVGEVATDEQVEQLLRERSPEGVVERRPQPFRVFEPVDRGRERFDRRDCIADQIADLGRGEAAD